MFKTRRQQNHEQPEADRPLILIIDDELQNLNVLEGLLKRSYQVIACGSGQDALDKIDSLDNPKKIKVIISDQRMPNMSGVEFFLKVKDDLPETLRIILTGYTDVNDIINSINKASIYKFINKPFQPDELLMTVNRACELFDIRERLRISESLKEEFINTVRHELRTPMNGISGGIELLKQSLSNPEESKKCNVENLDIIESAAKQMMTIVASISDFSSFDNSGLGLQEHRVVADLKTSFDGLIEAVVKQAAAKGISVQCKGLPASININSDIHKFRKIVASLLFNAVKFTDSGSISIEQSCDADSINPTLLVSIIDTGIGIDPAIKNRIFDMFVQGDGSDSRRYGGLGVGLALAKRLVDGLDGKIWYESEVGVGSKFFVELPVSIVGDSPESADQSANDSGEESSPKVKPLVVVVEDNSINQLVLSRILERLNCTVCVFDNGEEFVRWSQSAVADLVFMDCQMPVMNGYDATKKVRNDSSANRSTPIIACTANASSEDEKKCHEAGMDGFISKPLSIDRVRKILTKYIDNY